MSTGPQSVALVRRLLDALPQTQCTRCGYADCAAYAQAMAEQNAAINRCPPGGAEGVARLSSLTGRPVEALDPDCGTEQPRSVAWIDEDWCIGCTLCVKACPTDAILGSHQRMHTVMETHCTGCELCGPVCPVDCIHFEVVTPERTGWDAWSAEQALQARKRYEVRQQRLQHEAADQARRKQAELEAKAADLPAHSRIQDPAVLADKQRLIERALAKAREKSGRAV